MLVMIAVGLTACTATPAKVKPPEATFSSCYTLFGGKESITLQVEFKVSNPNKVLVKLDSFEFTLACKDKTIGGVQIANDYYIPAGGEITLPAAITVPFGSLVAEMMLGQGKSKSDAVKTVLPYWKKMGGANPVAPLQPVWEGIKPTVTYNASGVAYIIGNGQSLQTRFSKSLTPP